jgi:hypothetical protein
MEQLLLVFPYVVHCSYQRHLDVYALSDSYGCACREGGGGGSLVISSSPSSICATTKIAPRTRCVMTVLSCFNDCAFMTVLSCFHDRDFMTVLS